MDLHVAQIDTGTFYSLGMALTGLKVNRLKL